MAIFHLGILYGFTGIRRRKCAVNCKRCIESIRCYYKDSVIMLSDKNLYKYIKLPQFIEQKWDKGILSAAAYSDVIRFLYWSIMEGHG